MYKECRRIQCSFGWHSGDDFFSNIFKRKEIEDEEKTKIEEVGYYTLAFSLKENKHEEKYNGDKIVVEIQKEEDYLFNPTEENEDMFHVPIKFLTSKKESTNLKNIMAFDEKYFNQNKKKILKNYYKYCEKIEYTSPLYCATKPTKENRENSEENRKRYFWLVVKCPKKNMIKNIWLSAITEEGFLLFIKAKVKLQKMDTEVNISLLQQTTYYKSKNDIVALYR